MLMARCLGYRFLYYLCLICYVFVVGDSLSLNESWEECLICYVAYNVVEVIGGFVWKLVILFNRNGLGWLRCHKSLLTGSHRLQCPLHI